MEPVLSIAGLKKYYRSGVRGKVVAALDGLDLEVGRGEVFGLLGPNGAGKSTAIKIILGILRASAGQCLVFGAPISKAAKKRIGYLPEAPNFYRFLTGRELVIFYAKLCGLRGADAAARAEKALAGVGLGEAMDRRLSEYSKGMLQRAGLAQAIVHNPEFVILDEPSSGLDPVGMSDMADMIRLLKESGKTVLLCSHLLDEVEKLCDRVAIVSRGRVAACGRIDELLERENTWYLEAEGLNEICRSRVMQTVAECGGQVTSEGPAKMPLAEFFRKTVGEDAK